jgi:hypothetical protein
MKPVAGVTATSPHKKEKKLQRQGRAKTAYSQGLHQQEFKVRAVRQNQKGTMSLLCHSLRSSERNLCTQHSHECGAAAFVHIELDSLSIHLPAIHAVFFIPSSVNRQYEPAR